MKKFSFNRFMNVARWDLTINCKFYTRAAVLMVALACMPILLYYLYAIASGTLFNVSRYDNIETLGVLTALLGCAYAVISSGYMFHNLLTRQGRINELTLPATNLERFLWHFVVIVIGVNVVWFFGVLCADLLHALFRAVIPEAEIKSLTLFYYFDDYTLEPFDKYPSGMYLLITLLGLCYARSFSLVNAWKYRYNIPWTFLFHFILQNVITLFSVFIIIKVFDSSRDFGNFILGLKDMNPEIVMVCLNIFAALLYIGIWLLTYRLYCRAQITTRRNP